MKINANPMASFNREIPRAGPSAHSERTEKSAAATEVRKAAPPGLERAMARLQAIDESERSPGQANALNQIGRNLARYVETQAMAITPPSIVNEPQEQVVQEDGEPTDTALNLLLEQGTSTAPTQASEQEGAIVSDTDQSQADEAMLVETPDQAESSPT